MKKIRRAFHRVWKFATIITFQDKDAEKKFQIKTLAKSLNDFAKIESYKKSVIYANFYNK